MSIYFKSLIIAILVLLTACQISKVSPTSSASMEFLTKEAEGGNMDAQFKLAYIYDIDKKYDDAITWYQKSGISGHMHSQYRLYEMYRDGVGVNRDLNEAFFWLKKSAKNGYEGSELLYAKALYYGIFDLGLFNAIFEPNSKDKAKDSVDVFVKESLEKSKENSVELTLSTNFYKEVYTGNDLKSVDDHYGSLVSESEMKDIAVSSIILLGLAFIPMPAPISMGMPMSMSSIILEKDFEDAFKWFKKSAEKNDKQAQFYLGMMCEKGNGVSSSVDEAKKWYNKSALQEYKPAKIKLELLKKSEIDSISVKDTITKRETSLVNDSIIVVDTLAQSNGIIQDSISVKDTVTIEEISPVVDSVIVDTLLHSDSLKLVDTLQVLDSIK